MPLPLLWPQDPTKVDRSGAYIARQAAKSVVAAGLARRCLVQVSYAIGVPEPLSVFVDTYQTGTIPDKDILAKGGWVGWWGRVRWGGVGCAHAGLAGCRWRRGRQPARAAEQCRAVCCTTCRADLQPPCCPIPARPLQSRPPLTSAPA